MTKYMHWFKRTIATIMSIDRQQSETIDGREDPDFWRMIKFKRQMKRKQDMNLISIYFNPVFSYQTG